MTNPLSVDLDHILEHTRELWEDLRGQRIFITGGTGFFGSWLLESLLWANDRLNLKCQATILSRAPDTFRAKAPHLARDQAISVLQGDIQTFDFPDGEFRNVIHAATESSTQRQPGNQIQMLDTIVKGTRHALEFAKVCKAQNFLLTSSGAVYGKQPPQITHISEEYNGAPDPLDPRSAYGEGKRIAEHLCALYADSDLLPKIIRCFAFVGPYLPLDAHFAIGNFIHDALNGTPIIVKGDGTPRRSYLYAADLMIWLWTILFRGRSLRPYNVGSEEHLSVAELARTVANFVQPPLEVKIVGTPDPNKIVERYVPSTQLAYRELQLKTMINLPSSIQRTLEWNKRQ